MLIAEDISKSFFGVTVLDKLSMSIKDGDVHALLGHNGSGKSTFIKVLSGYYEPDRGPGTVRLDNAEMKLGDPSSSAAVGIRVVHQGLGVIGSLTVLENLRLGPRNYDARLMGKVGWRAERRRARAELAGVGLDGLAPDELVKHLSPVEQTGVAIARALQTSGGPVRCLILDEPTGTLPDSEVERLLALVQVLRRQQVSILYVTHRLDEIPRVAQHVTVLRDGKNVGSGAVEDFDQRRLIELIAGARPGDEGFVRTEPRIKNADVVDAMGGRRQGPSEESSLELRNVTTEKLHGISLKVAPGEVVGIVSLVAAGVEDIPRLLRGDQEFDGEVVVGGRSVKIRSPHDGRRKGVLVIPASIPEKIIEEMGVRENLTLETLRRFFRGGRMLGRAERGYARDLAARLQVRYPDLDSPTKLLSGGNKQKVVMGRALTARPRILVVEEPTNGVDVSGTKDILELLRDAGANGTTVVICSTDIEDLITACSRVIVLVGGVLQTELRGEEIERQRILEEVHGHVS
ncbi:MAG TPA: sugar ABC transporter ATP-binding protein [Solirubrobacteraceae bacterium]|jgi:ribose transport system ATP-binding protein